MQLHILVGTVHGNATEVAQSLAFSATDLGFDAQVRPMDGLTIDVFAQDAVFLLVCSTTGSGDVPDNAQALFEQLATRRPDLAGLSFGLVALGDMTYPQTFCFGGKRIGRLLTDLGATQVGEPLLHDASSGTLPEDVAADWFEAWVAAHDVLAWSEGGASAAA